MTTQSTTLLSLMPGDRVIKPTILLADDDPALLQNLQRLLESEFEVVASVSDGCALLEAAKTLVPDLIVTDISMPCLSGIRAARQLPGSFSRLCTTSQLFWRKQGRSELWVR